LPSTLQAKPKGQVKAQKQERKKTKIRESKQVILTDTGGDICQMREVFTGLPRT
jgi:hypothetical protein